VKKRFKSSNALSSIDNFKATGYFLVWIRDIGYEYIRYRQSDEDRFDEFRLPIGSPNKVSLVIRHEYFIRFLICPLRELLDEHLKRILTDLIVHDTLVLSDLIFGFVEIGHD
jgi:hypothetical protein